MIRFNKPYITGSETTYIKEAVDIGHLSGNGTFTKRCHSFFENKWGFHKCLLTTSCTDALEMCALLLDIQPGDEVIVPSYTFVSSALAFVRQGANIVFCDSLNDRPGIDEDLIESLITPKTKVIVPVHYAGVACDMDKIMDLANKYKLFVIEDAAQAINSYYKGKPLGSIGHLGCFSFHETKNIQCGEGGLLAINDPKFAKRAEIIWEKGTNRAEFFRGEVNKYGWVDTGSSFLPSDIVAAFLYAQLEKVDQIQEMRDAIWKLYYKTLEPLAKKGQIRLPIIPNFATNNGHNFYLLCKNLEERSALIQHLKKLNISTVFHYLSLHESPYYIDKHDGRSLPHANNHSNCLIRLPFYNTLEKEDISKISMSILSFYNLEF